MRSLRLVQVEQHGQVDGNGRVVLVGLHDVGHEVPPLPVDGRIGAGGPPLGVVDLDVAEQRQRVRVQRDGVVAAAVGVDHVDHLGPQLVVPPLVLLFHAGVQLHLERLDHRLLLGRRGLGPHAAGAFWGLC